jgi:Rieske Fe-S protein
MSDHPDLARRRVCQALCGASGLVALRTLPGCGTHGGNMAVCSAGAVGVGDAASLAVGQARYVDGLKVFVCRDSGGYYAMDAECTHIGTTVNFNDAKTGFSCPLHGSTFNFDGKVTMGPATTDLPHYELCTTESGLLIVDTSKKVTEDTRLLV